MIHCFDVHITMTITCVDGNESRDEQYNETYNIWDWGFHIITIIGLIR